MNKKIFAFFITIALILTFTVPAYAETKDELLESFLSILEENINNCNTEINIISDFVKEYDVEEIYLYDYFGYAVSKYSYSYRGNSVTYKITYRLGHLVANAYKTGNPDELGEQERLVYEKMMLILEDEINSEMSDYEKEKAIHDYLVLNTAYDQRKTIPKESYTPYGVLIKNTAVCEGYATAFKMFMDILEIECDYISGFTSDLQPHAWNRVKLDDEYYLVDVTWNDPIPDRPGVVRYSYFNLTDEMMPHIPDFESDKVSNSTKYNYFYYNNLIIKNQDDFNKALHEAAAQDAESVTLMGVDYDVNDINREVVFNYVKSSFKYEIDDKRNVIKIYLK